MLTWLKTLFQPPHPPSNLATAPVDPDDLKYSAELQSLRLELAERDKTITALKQDLEQQRQKEDSRLKTARQGEIENMLSQLASPISQLLTQTYLVEQEGTVVQPQDILTVTKRLVSTLETQGLSIVVPVGETVPFDLNYHQPLSSTMEIPLGTPVIVKMPALAYQQKLLKKALVEPTA
ncbi:nucleotide exchange factor GrpE [Synechocystis sp. PCC 7339]|uniref:nucleotide exchange factor GrpE n=1 Tax=unclassified Synechocystis TaxID=2640012 RepID=UPI001BAE5B75|nr:MULTISPECIES: nucleotide exchange factor GrpE [unclassified Synechocystis]QUS61729.1 nucleotide exchange factor GrpE [Synechocystis sp. PCC 7338]UAJ73927.1 nucleotide exchange factor GrpE [Synechocystis sp. PCC 7339]